MTTSQPAISSYGLIGDMRTAALIGLHGGIDWCCMPRFDSGSVFAALLDPSRGGTWVIQPQGEFTVRQQYFPQGFTHLALIHCAVALADCPI